MKTRILAIATALLSILHLHAQEPGDKYGVGSMPFNNDGNVVFNETVQIEQSADVLYSLAKSAIADIFVSAKNVIQLDDKDSHTLIAKGKNRISNVTIDFTLKIQTKDGRFRMSMYDITYTATVPNLPNTVWNAEELTDENCINPKNGQCKKNGKGYARRTVIDTKDKVFKSIISKMDSVSTEEDW